MVMTERMFKIVSRPESEKNENERVKQLRTLVEEAQAELEQAKKQYDVEDSKMSSYNPSRLPKGRQMVISQEVLEDYQRILKETKTDANEHNFIWLGNKREINGQVCYCIEKAVAVPENPEELQRSAAQTEPKLTIYKEAAKLLAGYDIVVDGHSHPKQDPGYKGFDRLPQKLLDDLSLAPPGENFSVGDLMHYMTLLNETVGGNITEKTIIGAVITYTGKMLTIVSDSDETFASPSTVSQISTIKKSATDGADI